MVPTKFGYVLVWLKLRQVAKEIRLKLVRHMGLAPGLVLTLGTNGILFGIRSTGIILRYGGALEAGGISENHQWQDPAQPIEDSQHNSGGHGLVWTCMDDFLLRDVKRNLNSASSRISTV